MTLFRSTLPACATRPARSARRAGAAAALVLATTLLAGCGVNLRQELGLVGQGPDEFTVVRNRPLVIPEQKDALPSPNPGAPSLVAPTPQADAARLLTGSDAPNAAPGAPASSSEAALLAAANANAADPTIRQELEDADAAEEAVTVRLLDTVFGVDRDANATLDPAAEAERLRRLQGQAPPPAE